MIIIIFLRHKLYLHSSLFLSIYRLQCSSWTIIHLNYKRKKIENSIILFFFCFASWFFFLFVFFLEGGVEEINDYYDHFENKQTNKPNKTYYKQWFLLKWFFQNTNKVVETVKYLCRYIYISPKFETRTTYSSIAWFCL